MKLTIKPVAAMLAFSVASALLPASQAVASTRLNSPIGQILQSLAANCQNFTLDTEQDHVFEISDHHQSMTLSHRWPDGSALAFVSHSETGNGDQGQLLAFKLAAQHFQSGTDVIGADVTLPLQHKIYFSEQHPSGIAWLPAAGVPERGYLLVASENQRKVRVHQFSQNGQTAELVGLEQQQLDQITDVWLAQQGEYQWLMLHNMNKATGSAYRAKTADLFQLGTPRQGELDLNAFRLINQYQSPANTGCGKSLGQNAQLVQDSHQQWFVVHTYTGETVCGANSGQNIVKAYPAAFSAQGEFSVSTNPVPVAHTTVGSSTLPDGRGADGAAGFRVSQDGQLVIYLGGQYAYNSWFDWKTAARECRSAKR